MNNRLNIPEYSPMGESPDEKQQAQKELERRGTGWYTCVIYTIPLICVGVLGLLWYNDYQTRHLDQARFQQAFAPILEDLQSQCSPETISRALEEWNEDPKEPYRTGHVLVYDVYQGSISLEHHFLPENIQAKSSSDLETVLCFWEDKIAVGEYQAIDGASLGKAYQLVWNFVGFDWTSRKEIAVVAFVGDKPPLQGLGPGSHTGLAPFPKFRKWISTLPEK